MDINFSGFGVFGIGFGSLVFWIGCREENWVTIAYRLGLLPNWPTFDGTPRWIILTKADFGRTGLALLVTDVGLSLTPAIYWTPSTSH
jgi:hypothetical protein